jgi:hypothetical protein
MCVCVCFVMMLRKSSNFPTHNLILIIIRTQMYVCAQAGCPTAYYVLKLVMF